MVAKLSWAAHLHKEESPIIDLFLGQETNTIICANEQCKYEYTIFQPFAFLHLSAQHGDNLYESLNHYTRRQTVNRYKWLCKKCKKDLPNSEKKTTIQQFPPVLLIDIKKEDRKPPNQKMMTYPLELDLTPYESEQGQQSPPKYKLCAVATMIDGSHCTAYGRNSKEWRHFDNLQNNAAQIVSPEEVVVNSAYILFYQRISWAN